MKKGSSKRRGDSVTDLDESSPRSDISLGRRKSATSHRKLSLAKSFSKRVVTNFPREQFTDSVTSWGPMVGHTLGEDEADDDLLDKLLDMEEQKRKKSAKKNVRARMGYYKLKYHDFKTWLHRMRNKSWEIPLLKSYIKEMESNFGSGIGTFFVFTRWMIALNLFLSFLWICFVIFPSALHFDYSCMQQPFSYLNLVDGKGPVGESWIFYCAYTPQVGTSHFTGQMQSTVPIYHSGLAYLVMIIITYFGSFGLILHSMAAGKQPKYSQSVKIRFRFSHLVLSAWDHSIMAPEATANLSKGISSSLKDNLYEVKAAGIKQQWTRRDKTKIYFQRFLAWTITTVLLGAGCSGIVFLVIYTNFSSPEEIAAVNPTGIEKQMDAFKEYITPVSFSLINMIVPFCIKFLTKIERYTIGKTEQNITLARVFLLRTANLAALLASLYKMAEKHTSTDEQGQAMCNSHCLGTKIGQELYKLIIMDTVIHTSGNFLGKFILYYWSKNKQEFDISTSVLAIIYRQGLIWIGTIACPALPLVGVLSDLIFFFLMYGIIRHTCKPPIKRWAQSRNTVFFMTFLLLSLLCVLPPVCVIVGSDVIDLGQTRNATIRYGPFSNGKMPTSAYMDFAISLNIPVVTYIFQMFVSDIIITPLVFMLMSLLIYGFIRIDGEKKHGLVLQAELQQEREDNKNLMKKVRQLKLGI